MILVIRKARLIRELLEISHDRLLPHEYPKEPLLPGFKCLILQADGVGFGIGAVDTPSALAYASSVRENEAIGPPSMPIVLHVGVEINPVVDLAAAFADEWQAHAIEEPQTAPDVGGSLRTGEVAGGNCRTRGDERRR